MGMGSSGVSDNRPVSLAYNGPAGNSKKASSGAQPDSLIQGKPTVYQPMNKDESGWEMSNWSNGNPFNATWRADHVEFNNGIMSLKLDKDGCPSGCDEHPYVSGEYRTTKEYSYGYYETRMKTSKGAGLVAGTFFTYTGVYGQQSHHEIDMELLGKDPARIQLNYYTEGRGNHEKMVDLGFDASEGFHDYGFLWKKDYLEWYIDGKSVYKVTDSVPFKAGKIMVNFWPGTPEVSGWLGGVYDGSGGKVQYDWIKYLSLDQAKNEPVAAPSKPATGNAPAEKTSGGSIFNKVAMAQNGFNGASVNISGADITIEANNSTDAGLASQLRSKVSGNLVFNYKGKASGGYRGGAFTIIFIKQGPGGDYTKDQQLDEKSIVPSGVTQEASVKIPEGTDKINIMLVGHGSLNIELTNVKIVK